MSSLFSKTSALRKDLKILDAEFVQMRDFIYSQSGIFVADSRRYLIENRLASRLKELNLKTFAEYYYYLQYDPGRRQELNRLFEVITTNETSFYRNPPQLKIFQDNILPEVLERLRARRERRLRIWSAGCSTGEEPYTLAIILMETLRAELPSWDIRIIANDLSEAVLAAARQGYYTEYSLRTTPREIVARYFIQDGPRFVIRPEVRRLVAFGQINLSDRAQLKRVERSQVVFCRNVIIYFDDEMKKSVIGAFYDNLLPGGFLFIGHSESLHNISRAFRPKQYPGAIVYRKEE
ncbi:MAG: CheR family methyltransferase [Thermodesulfobacteriota bacterium]